MTHAVLARLVPVLSIIVLVLISVTPLGLGPKAQFALPLLPFAAIHFWRLESERPLSTGLVFLAGIAVDVLTFGPLGYWALVYLGGVALAEAVGALGLPMRRLARWLVFAAVQGAVCALGFVLACLYFGRLVDPEPMLWAAGGLAVAYPVIASLLGAMDRIGQRPRVLNLERKA